MPTPGTHPLATGLGFAFQGADGTLPRLDDTGALTVASVGTPGAVTIELGGYALFNGTTLLRAASNLGLTAGYTCAFFYRPTGSGAIPFSVTWGDSDYLEVFDDAGSVRCRLRSGVNSADSIGDDLISGAWNAVFITVTATTIQVEINGVLGTVGDRTAVSPAGSDSYITMGALTRGGGSTQNLVPDLSRMRNVAVWPARLLTAPERAAWRGNPDLIYGSAGPVITGPTGAAGAASITTSSPENQNILGVWTATGTGTWSLSGPDAADLTISGGTVTRTAGNLDRETKPTWNFTVNFGTAAQAVVHTVTDINEPPAFIGPALGALVFTQGVPITPVPLATRFVDPEGLAITATIVGALPAGLSVVSGQLQGTPTATQAATSYTPRGADPAGNATNGTPFTIAIGATPPPPPPPPPPPAAFTALTDVMAESGINLAPGSTAFWSWFPNGRPGAMGTGIEGSSLVNAQGRALISHSVAGAGMVVVGTRPGPAVSDDRVFIDFLVLA